MKKLTLIIAGLMIAGSSFAHDGKSCCKGKKEDCKKEAKVAAKGECKEKGGCCKKGTATTSTTSTTTSTTTAQK